MNEIIDLAIQDNQSVARELGLEFTEDDAMAIREGHMVALMTVVMPQYRGRKARVHARRAWQGANGAIYWTDEDDAPRTIEVAPNHYKGFMEDEIAEWAAGKLLPGLPSVYI